MTEKQIIRWWELRRVVYNALLLAIGVAALWRMERFLNSAPSVSDRAGETLGLVLLSAGYVLAGNIFYTLGWVLELQDRENAPELARKRAASNFRKGLWFSCGLTTLPFWLGLVFWVAHRR